MPSNTHVYYLTALEVGSLMHVSWANIKLLVGMHSFLGVPVGRIISLPFPEKHPCNE